MSNNWKYKYYGLHFVQKFLGLIPAFYRVQEYWKSITGHWEKKITKDFVCYRVQLKIDQFNRLGIHPPGVIVEQGTGWHGIDLVLFYLGGANHIFTYDTRPWLRIDLLRRVAKIILEEIDLVLKWKGIDDQVSTRASRLRKNLTDQHSHILNNMNVKYYVTSMMDRPQIASGSVDLFYSDSVLQRMKPLDLENIIQESYRMLHEKGSSFHVVDCRDFHSSTDKRIPDLYYLKYPDWLWKFITSKYLNYQNRLRLPDFIRIFTNGGFKCSVHNEVIKPENERFVKDNFENDPRFNGMSVKDVSVTRLELVAHC